MDYCNKLKALKLVTNSTTSGGSNLEFFSNIAVNHDVSLDNQVQRNLLDNKYKHKHHPGIIQLQNTRLPDKLQNAISILIEKYPLKELNEKSQDLSNQLWSRRLPPSEQEAYKVISNLENKILANKKLTNLDDNEQEVLENQVRREMVPQLRKTLYHWKSINYSAYTCILYLVARMSFDYSVLKQIFHEINLRFNNFQPKTLFDFGSGVGSTIWAANSIWPQSLAENYCVDISADMNTLARLLLQGGDEDKDMCFPGVYFRQFFPPSLQNKYDLVVSAFSLTELSTQAERLKTVHALWQKTQHLLVIVENGTNAGFQSVLEARDFVLQLNTELENVDYSSNESLKGHVLMPCPHNHSCPRLKREDGTPCNFRVDFDAFALHKSSNTVNKQITRYSYVVLQKGTHCNAVSTNWPRIVRPEKKASKMIHLETCSPSGQLEQCVITAKQHGRDLYWCARTCKWGDLLPVSSTRKEICNESTVDQQSDSIENVRANVRQKKQKYSLSCNNTETEKLHKISSSQNDSDKIFS